MSPLTASKKVIHVAKVEKGALKSASPQELIEGFVREWKIFEFADVDAANRQYPVAVAYDEEIARRGGLRSLAPLMDHDDPFIAYNAARLLMALDDLRDRALATLDRIADARVGFASSQADTARHIARYGEPYPSAEVIARIDRGGR